MNFFILLLASFALGADLSTVSVSPESVNIRTTTIYHVNLRTITTIPSGGSIKIVFPSLFTSLTSGSVECAATSLQSSCSPACTFSGNSMTLQNCFPQTSATIRIDLYNIKNPDYAGTSSSFQIFTYDASASNLDQRTSGVALTFNYAIMNSVELTTGTQITGENSVWTVKFNINYSIIAGGYLSLSFPL